MTKNNKYQMLFKRLVSPENCWTLLTAGLVLIVTCFPFRVPGLYGYEPDALYHLNRIEGVRDALLHGRYPAAIYTNFFDGQGYGSPLFYPDLLLIFPALLRILHCSPLKAYKLTCAVFSVLLVLVTERSMKMVCRRWEPAIAGTALFALSQYVLADLVIRVGFSSYLSNIFLPPLIAGLADFFTREGRHVRLIGFSLGGLILTHTLNAFQGLLLTAAVFVVMAFTRDGRAAYRDKKRMLRLGTAALFTLALTAWYWAPMLEQMCSGVDFVYRHPWADIGEFTQPWEEFFALTGYFFNIAHVGIGIPILLFIGSRLFAGRPEDAAGRFGDLCYSLGLALFAAMTDLVPWKVFSHTLLNQLQFTFRIYPFALLFLIFGLVMLFDRMLPQQTAGGRGRDFRMSAVMLSALLLSVVFGVVQNRTVTTADPEVFHLITEETLAEENDVVGRGEWLPCAYDPEAERAETVESAGLVIPARIYYKGYRAVLTAADGSRVTLPVYMEENPERLEGSVSLIYRRTAVQLVSLFLSLLTLAVLCGLRPLRRLFSGNR